MDETLVVPMLAFQELAVGEIAAHDESKAAILGYLGRSMFVRSTPTTPTTRR